MTIAYDDRKVAAHGSLDATVFLVNEAPGDCEAHECIPSVASQGGEIFRSLRKARVKWALDLKDFPWPTGIQSNYANPNGHRVAQQFKDRSDALDTRAKHITCTNAYDQWPTKESQRFARPEDHLVRSVDNMERLRMEATQNHRVLLICGRSAWLACHGTTLEDSAVKERTRIPQSELETINSNLRASFERAWYMGHTRRWTLKGNKHGMLRSIEEVLRDIALAAGWPLAG